MKIVLLPAVLTGVFCSVFAVGVNVLTMPFTVWTIMGLAFVSGFLGNLFAQLVLRKDK